MIEQQTRINPMQLWTESMAAWNDLGRSAGQAWMDAMMAMQPGTGEDAPEAATRDLFRKLSLSPTSVA